VTHTRYTQAKIDNELYDKTWEDSKIRRNKIIAHLDLNKRKQLKIESLVDNQKKLTEKIRGQIFTSKLVTLTALNLC